jgi:ABC-type multidrug transport system fused ATPase/permease subunit
MTYRQALKSALALLTKKERKSLLVSLVAQVLIGTLDIIGVVSISITSLLVVRGNGSSNQLMKYLPDFLESNPEKLAGVFAIVAVISLVLKSLGSFLTTRFLLFRLSKIQNRITLKLFDDCLSMSPSEFMKESQKSLPSVVAEGTGNLTLGLIGFSMLAFTETVVLSMLLIPLLVIAPLLTLLTMLVFAAAFLMLHKLLSKWSTKSGLDSANGLNDLRNLVFSVGKLSKVLWVSNETEAFTRNMRVLSTKTSKATSDTYFVQQVPKYVLEMTVILIGIVTALYLSTTSSLGKSIGILTLLVATSFRLLPSLLRVQGAVLIARTSIGRSLEVIELNSIHKNENKEHKSRNRARNHGLKNEVPGLRIENLNFGYEGSDKLVINNLSLVISPCTITVIKGKSGVGKSTLVDLILGILEPSSGLIEFTGISNSEIRKSFMPQETTIIDGSLVENIALGIPVEDIDQVKIEEVLVATGLDLIMKEENIEKLDKIGRDGRQLSGGQYQRVGLARALYPNPGLIILDEPTSALDLVSEEMILRTLHGLRKEITVIIIAHSDKPLHFADQIIELNS